MGDRLQGFILVGGRGRRLSRDKPFLKVGGIPILERTFGVLSRVCRAVTLISNGRRFPLPSGPASYLDDLIPSLGPVGGIYTGLKHATSPAFFCAGDLPFLQSELVMFLCGLAPVESSIQRAVVPRIGGKLEPLVAVYAPSLLPCFEEGIASGDFALQSTLSRLPVQVIEEEEIRKYDPELLSFLNVNTPEDLQRARCLAGDSAACQAWAGEDR